jgi:hypothetical protein
MTVCSNTLNMPLVVTLLTGPPGPPGQNGSGGGNWYLSQFVGDGIKSSFYPITGYSTTDAARYEVVIDGVQQEPNFSFDILADNGGTVLFPVAIYAGARITVRTTNT